MARKIHRLNFISVPESYDLYEDNSKLQMLSEKKISGNFSDMPIFCYMLLETVRHGYRWYKHVKYPNIALELILDGRRQYHSENNGVQIAESGMLYIVSPGSSVSFSIFGDSPLHHVVLLIKGSNLGSIASALRMDEDKLIKVENPALLAEKFRQIANFFDDDSLRYQNSVMTYELLLEIYRQIPEADDHFKKARQIMAEHCFENISIDEISAQCKMSSNSLRRLFQKRAGMSPLKYLTGLRLKKAVTMLSHSAASVRQIARKCGFADPSRFCSVFRKQYGTTPEQFRKHCRMEKSTPGKTAK